METTHPLTSPAQPVRMTSSEFKKRQRQAFELVKSGQPVEVSYCGEIFDIVLREHRPSSNEAFLEKLERSEAQIDAGQCVRFKTHEALQAWLDQQ